MASSLAGMAALCEPRERALASLAFSSLGEASKPFDGMIHRFYPSMTTWRRRRHGNEDRGITRQPCEGL
jgi:hypothetical protein